MPNFNRRGFLQVLSAAGMAPLLPSLAGRAATASGVSHSKALWAGIYAKSGSASKFVGTARGMGLSTGAIQGIGARSVGVRIALAAATKPIARGAIANQGALPQPTSSSRRLDATRDVLRDLKRVLTDEAGEGLVAEDLDAKVSDVPSVADLPHKNLR